MKHLIIALLLLMPFSVFSQSVNDYQYVIVPEKYEFAKSIDQYQLNSLTQFLFNKYGFDSYRERDEKPVGLKNGSCNALYADLESRSNLIVARIKIILKDCNGNVIFTSTEGKSKNKDFKRAYHEALRNAFISIEGLKYAYNGKSQESQKEDPATEEIVETVVPEKKTVKQLKTESVEEVEVIEETPVTKITSTEGTYKSPDGIYKLIVVGDHITIYEGSQKIGSAITNDNKTYDVLTTQFNGKGHFKNNSFIIDRVVKGIGTVQMIFSKG